MNYSDRRERINIELAKKKICSNKFNEPTSENLIMKAFSSNLNDYNKYDSADEEYKEKIGGEEEHKDELEGVLLKEIIKFPRMEITVMHARTNPLNSTDKIILTPNSINGLIKKSGEKFVFGRNSLPNSNANANFNASSPIVNIVQNQTNRLNDYNFTDDDSISLKQFEISYNKERNLYSVVDNKRGSGLFLKIKQKIIDHDMIVSFCATHMIIQLESEGIISCIISYNQLTFPNIKLLNFYFYRALIKTEKKYLIQEIQNLFA